MELIISALRSEEESFTSFGYLISSIKQSLDIFSCISFLHTCRTGNSLAHNLAQYARHIDALTVRIEDVPPHLHYVIVTDFSWFNKVSLAWFSKKKKNHVYCCKNTSVKDVDLDLCMLVACFILSSKSVYYYNSVYLILWFKDD